MDVTIRRLPRTTWLRVFMGGRACEPGRGWYYSGILYRAAWRLGPVAFGWIWMPSAQGADLGAARMGE